MQVRDREIRPILKFVKKSRVLVYIREVSQLIELDARMCDA